MCNFFAQVSLLGAVPQGLRKQCGCTGARPGMQCAAALRSGTAGGLEWGTGASPKCPAPRSLMPWPWARTPPRCARRACLSTWCRTRPSRVGVGRGGWAQRVQLAD